MYKGSCLCRSVQYSASELRGPFVYCHCESCRKGNGSAFAANIAVPIDGFEISAGQELIRSYESSPGKLRHFCGRCGSPLFTKVGKDPELVRIRLGTLDSNFEETTSAHIFTAEKATWHEISDTTPRHPGWPDPAALAVPGSRQTHRNES